MKTKNKQTDAVRMQAVLDALESNPNRLANKLGYKSNTSIRHVVDGRNNISVSMANKIVEAYPRVNFLYLIKGELPVVLDGAGKTNQDNMFYNRNEVKDFMKEVITLLREQNYLLSKLVDNQDKNT